MFWGEVILKANWDESRESRGWHQRRQRTRANFCVVTSARRVRTSNKPRHVVWGSRFDCLRENKWVSHSRINATLHGSNDSNEIVVTVHWTPNLCKSLSYNRIICTITSATILIPQLVGWERSVGKKHLRFRSFSFPRVIETFVSDNANYRLFYLFEIFFSFQLFNFNVEGWGEIEVC